MIFICFKISLFQVWNKNIKHGSVHKVMRTPAPWVHVTRVMRGEGKGERGSRNISVFGCKD